MKIIRTKDYQDMSRKAANIISAQMILKDDSVLGLATGSTPIGIYDQLVDWYKKGDLDFSKITTVNLDEYKGLPKENDQSYWYFMNKNLFSRVNIRPDYHFLPDGTNLDSDNECERYEKLIDSLGGIDLQLLGLGRNGHIGFNEPCDSFPQDVHVVDLTESTIEANKRFFASADDVPKQAYTMGVGTILRAKAILLVVSGKDKAEALNAVVNGPITPQVPGSVLRLHPNVIYKRIFYKSSFVCNKKEKSYRRNMMFLFERTTKEIIFCLHDFSIICVLQKLCHHGNTGFIAGDFCKLAVVEQITHDKRFGNE